MTYMFAVACTPHIHVVFSMFETTHMYVRRTCAMNVYDTCTAYMYATYMFHSVNTALKGVFSWLLLTLA